MKVAKVIGNIWATRKEEKLAGLKLLLGETVLVVGGSSARSAAGDMSIPVDATVVGIVDDQEIDRSVLP